MHSDCHGVSTYFTLTGRLFPVVKTDGEGGSSVAALHGPCVNAFICDVYFGIVPHLSFFRCLVKTCIVIVAFLEIFNYILRKFPDRHA